MRESYQGITLYPFSIKNSVNQSLELHSRWYALQLCQAWRHAIPLRQTLAFAHQLLCYCRLHLELKPSGAVHVLPDPTSHGSSSCSSSSTHPQRRQPEASYPGLDGFQPQWLLLAESNDWRKRVQVAQRFVHAARVVIYRNRAQARLRRLRALAGGLGRRSSQSPLIGCEGGLLASNKALMLALRVPLR